MCLPCRVILFRFTYSCSMLMQYDYLEPSSSCSSGSCVYTHYVVRDECIPQTTLKILETSNLD